jgi:dTDP-4-dehydrorhamnose 3,5-epimerase-like enzyme
MAQAARDMSWGRFHMDDRGIRYCDIFPEIGSGDINVSVIEPGAAALWHRHKKQADYQLVVKGSLKVGMCNMPNTDFDMDCSVSTLTSIKKHQDPFVEEWPDIKKNYVLNDWSDEPEVRWHYLSERNADEGALFIPTGLWHGCYNYTNEPAILIYHITTKYDGTDEDRMDPKLAMWDYERVNH